MAWATCTDEERVATTHGATVYGQEYQAIIACVKALKALYPSVRPD